MENKTQPSLFNSLDFKLLINQLKKSTVWIILIFILTFIGAKLKIKYTPEQFSTSIIIKINDQKTSKNIISAQSISQDDKLREIAVIIQSPFLISKALKNMNYNIGYFNQGKILTNTQYKSAPYRVTFLNKTQFTETYKTFNINFDIENKNFTIQVNNEIVIQNGQEDSIYSLDNDDFKLTNINYEALKSFDDDDQLYFTKIDHLNLARGLNKTISVFTLDGSAKTIQIKVNGTNGRFNYDLLQSLYKTYIDYDVNEKSKSANKIINFIDNQLNIVTIDLQNYERQLHNFKKDNKTDCQTTLADLEKKQQKQQKKTNKDVQTTLADLEKQQNKYVV